MKGSCLCGGVAYEVSQLDTPISHCSCKTCRKAHSAAFNTGAGVKHTHFRWIRGQELLKSFESSKGKLRFFCSYCGTHLIAQRAAQEHLVLRVATLDESPRQTPAFHIFKSHKVSWLKYDEDIPAYPEWQPGRV
ncbi:GFA family protein [Methylophilus sp. 5]|uniref:GFA family protein n=1 Tax=Methylophilus sp. 5 TaxID=1112274 RepID=UPI0009E05ABE